MIGAATAAETCVMPPPGLGLRKSISRGGGRTRRRRQLRIQRYKRSFSSFNPFEAVCGVTDLLLVVGGGRVHIAQVAQIAQLFRLSNEVVLETLVVAEDIGFYVIVDANVKCRAPPVAVAGATNGSSSHLS